MASSTTRKVIDLIRTRKLSIVGIFVIASLVLVVYAPAIKSGFLMNDWMFLNDAATLPMPQFLLRSFDPSAQTYGYRPLHNIRILVDYWLFGLNADAYHLVQITFHLVNCLLLAAIVRRAGGQRPIAYLAAILFATLPTFYMAVLWLSDPVTIPFYLLAILLWIVYLQGQARWAYVLTVLVSVMALMTKEINVVLPLILVLVDRGIVGNPTTRSELAHRYAPFAALLPAYLFIEYTIQTRGVFIAVAGWGLGSRVLLNFLRYLSALTFPWFAWFPVGEPDLGLPYQAWMLSWIAFVILVILIKRARKLAFLAFASIIPIMPVLGFSLEWFDTRYLYYPSMAIAVLVAVLVASAARSIGRGQLPILVTSLSLALLVAVNASVIAGYTARWIEVGRQRRVPFRDIERAHNAFERDSYIYLLESPGGTTFDLASMLTLRYAGNLSVERLENQPAHLRDHAHSFVYYFDETGRPIEVPADNHAGTELSYPLPLQFANSVRLESVELPRSSVRHGEALVLLFTWKATVKLDKDYTVFAHLVNPRGDVVLGQDSQPRGGGAPTSQWLPGQPVPDAMVILIPDDVPAGDDYRLELGLYYLPTMERVPVVAEPGPAADGLLIEPIVVIQ